jgi:hypothetical protein
MAFMNRNSYRAAPMIREQTVVHLQEAVQTI